LVTGIPFLAVMGLAAAGTVAISLLIALTLLQALMGFLEARLAKGTRQDPIRRPIDDMSATDWTAVCRENGWTDSIVRRGGAAKAHDRRELETGGFAGRRVSAAHRWRRSCRLGHARS
jgi:MMPL family